MSKSLFVKKVNNQDLALEYRVLQHTFASVDVHAIDNAPWHERYPYKPQVTFKMVHSEDTLGIYYTVNEEFVKANAIRANERVFEDSCVEFFFSLDNKKTYYNFEFNVLGTGLIGYGPAVKAERNRLSAEIIDAVDTMTIVTKQDGLKSWEIFLIIPKSIVTTEELSGYIAHANFYKCGDLLPNPHFMSWNTIDNPTPNFHLPQFFGELVFQ